MAIYVCRACGAESRHWQKGIVCAHCGAAYFNRLTPAMVKEQLGVMAYLYGDKTNRPQTGKVTKRQLELFGRK